MRARTSEAARRARARTQTSQRPRASSVQDTGARAHGARSAAALGAIPLRHGAKGIPTFAEVLALVAGQVPLLGEIKDQDGAMGPDVGALEDAAAAIEAIESRQAKGKLVIVPGPESKL